jgi:hypothetical protein
VLVLGIKDHGYLLNRLVSSGDISYGGDAIAGKLNVINFNHTASTILKCPD